MSAPDRKAREALLHEMWMETTRAWLTILRSTDPQDMNAALLTSARQYLTDNGISHQTIRADEDRAETMARELAQQVAELGELEGEPEGEPLGEASGEPLPAPTWPVRIEDK